MNKTKLIYDKTQRVIKVGLNTNSLQALIKLLFQHHVVALEKKPNNYSEQYAFDSIIIDTDNLLNRLYKQVHRINTIRFVGMKFTKKESALIMVCIKDVISHELTAYDIYTQIDKQIVNFK
jgi:hypothetical protein